MEAILKRILIALVVCLCTPLAATAETIEGKVIAISDGDTLTILSSKSEQTKIRLAEIDAPESGQPYGKKSKQLLSKLVFGKKVIVDVQDHDRYGRTVGRIYFGGVDINKALISNGAAWAYRKYLKDPELIEAEAQAKQKGIGLWALPEHQRVPPWEWRQGNRSPSQSGFDTLTASSEHSCAHKPYCKQIQSCEQAMFYLKQCGLARLDGDNDGLPCEALCR